MELTKSEIIASVKRELALRRNLYPKWVSSGRMTQIKADHEINTMQGALNLLESKNITLADLFSKQKELMQIIQKRSGIKPNASQAILALMVEAGELANENGEFKTWKKNHIKNIPAQLIELIDILFFYLQFAIIEGYTAADLETAYLEKWQINIDRQKNNY